MVSLPFWKFWCIYLIKYRFIFQETFHEIYDIRLKRCTWEKISTIFKTNIVHYFSLPRTRRCLERKGHIEMETWN